MKQAGRGKRGLVAWHGLDDSGNAASRHRPPRVAGEARDAVHAEEGLQRRGAREHDVQAQVELEPIQQQGAREVHLVGAWGHVAV